MPSDRYARQRRVREVGWSGQRRLCQLTVVLPATATADLEALYLERAGARVERCALATEAPFALAGEFLHPGPRAVAAAAHRALLALRQGLGLDEPAPTRKATLS